MRTASRNNLTAGLWPFGDTLVMVKVQHGETLRHFLSHGTLRKTNVLPLSHLFVPVAVNKQNWMKRKHVVEES